MTSDGSAAVGPQARVLFVTRKFPPSVGGMQTLAADVWTAVQHRWPRARLISFGGAPALSVLWMPWAVLRAAVLVATGRVDAVVAGDGMMAVGLRPVLALRALPSVAFVFGLDLTWNRFGYRHLVRRALRGFGRLAASSEATVRVAAEVTGRDDGIELIRLAVRPPARTADAAAARAAVVQRWSLPERALILTTLGRVVARKGAAWFVEQVLPGLPAAHYVIAGTGPHLAEVRAAAARAGVGDRVVCTGPVTDAEREDLLAGTDLFVQPNIVVAGDMEGFGLVVVEAAVRGAVVVAAGVEGLQDAVLDGRTGFLVPSGDADAWRRRIEELADPSVRDGWRPRVAQAARSRFGIDQMSERLAEIVAAAG